MLLLPGAGSTRTAVMGQAAVLARHGYGALLHDTGGHGLLLALAGVQRAIG